MSTFAERIMQRTSWSGLMMGNHALVRAMLESGVRVATTYPGSPTPEIADAINAISESIRPLHFEYCTNEKVAAEVAFGASINGHPATVFFKSVGLNVALDSIVQFSMMETIGGLVIVLGDDPGANSSQNEQDNRHIARMAYLPMFEPGTPAEFYGMFKEAMELSRSMRMPVFLRSTTHVCHAREVVQFGALPDDTGILIRLPETHDYSLPGTLSTIRYPVSPFLTIPNSLANSSIYSVSVSRRYTDSCSRFFSRSSCISSRCSLSRMRDSSQ